MNNQFGADERRHWVRVGLWRGGKYGLLLGFGYMVMALLGTLLATTDALTPASAPTTGVSLPDPPVILEGAMLLLVFSFFYLAFGTAIGVLPAAAIGALSGALLGAVLSLPHIGPNRWNRLAVGGGSSLVIAAAVNQGALQLFWHGSIDRLGPHLFFIGIPSLVYVATLLWLSDHLPALVAADSGVYEFPARSTGLTVVGE